jgi:trigger factor
VPMAHMKKVYGRSVMADVVQSAINDAQQRIVEEHGLKLAMQPQIAFPEDKETVEAALEARGDLNLKVALEVLPKFDVASFDDLALERPVAEVEPADVDKMVERLADQNRAYTARPAGEKARSGDQVKVDFVGTLNGEAFEGGTSNDIDVTLGSNTFIPGFEEGLDGAVEGEKRMVKATFPENYATRHLAGRTGDFDVTVKSVSAPDAVTIDDEFAKKYGFESLPKMREAMQERLQADYAKQSRAKAKRQLLDALASRYSFEVPDGLVDQEFAQIWQQVDNDRQASKRSFEDEGTTEEKARAEYRAIAVRRVRLGLLLAEIGQRADVKVTDEEMTEALVRQARAYPGQEKAIWDYYRNNAQALNSLRAPVYEEKVVDHVLALAKVTDRKVSAVELAKEDDELAIAG